MKMMRGAVLAAGLMTAVPGAAQDVVVTEMPSSVAAFQEQSIDELQTLMTTGKQTSAGITELYLERIKMLDRRGPTLRSVIAVSPNAIEQARASDARRKAKKLLGPLDGVPILIKDNIETKELPTTAGSLALKNNMTRRDAPLVAKLRAAGAVILGKTNLSEWANIRSNRSMSGWSAVGGLVRNPYALDRSACGSSSGTGVAVAASLAAGGIGTETDGSVVCPSSMNGLVGLKPTIGMVSRTHVVPISHSQDTPGPMTRSVRDAAILFSAMVGEDPADAATKGANARKRDFAAGLSADALKGMRIAVLRPPVSADLMTRFDAALAVLKDAGAVLVPVERPQLEGMGAGEHIVLMTELKADLNAYLATTPPGVTARTLDQVIAFNTANASTEMPFFGQETFIEAAKTKGLDDPEYKAGREKSAQLAGPEGIDAMLAKADATVLVEPTYGAAWLSDTVYGDQSDEPSASALPAVSGYPHLTVPMGLVRGLPVGLSFIGTAWSEATLLNAGYSFEQHAKARVAPRYLPSVVPGPGLEGVRR